MKRSHPQVSQEASSDFSVEEDVNFDELPDLSKYFPSSSSQSSFPLASKQSHQGKRKVSKKKPKNINEMIQSLSEEEETGKNDQKEPNEWSANPATETNELQMT